MRSSSPSLVAADVSSLQLILLALALTLSLATAWTAQAAAVPKTGASVAAFESVDQDAKPWKSADHIGKKVVLLYFYPKDDTPGCTKEACGLRDRMPELERDGVEVVGVSLDSPESHRAFRAKHNLNFTLLSDKDGKLADQFGVRMADRPMARRVSFLIGKDGKIAAVTDNPDAQVHLDEMKAAIARLPKTAKAQTTGAPRQ